MTCSCQSPTCAAQHVDYATWADRVVTADAGGLDEAWAEAEATLPHRGDRRASWSLALRTNGKGTYVAEALPPFLPYEEWFEARREAFGDDPSEALRALRAVLRDKA